MKVYLQRLFKNNGVARGWLYVITALALSLGDDAYEFGKWLVDQREMLIAREMSIFDGCALFFLSGGKLFLAAGAALNTLRAYLDQHLSKKDEKNTDTVTVTR
jgi:hypothetical protein